MYGPRLLEQSDNLTLVPGIHVNMIELEWKNSSVFPQGKQNGIPCSVRCVGYFTIVSYHKDQGTTKKLVPFTVSHQTKQSKNKKFRLRTLHFPTKNWKETILHVQCNQSTLRNIPFLHSRFYHTTQWRRTQTLLLVLHKHLFAIDD